MMKKFLYCLLLVSSVSFAGTKVGFNEPDQTGIITPDIAVAFIAYSRYAYNIDGSGMSVCKEEDWGMGGSCKKWTPTTQAIPSGRKYVGFKVVSGAYGHRQLEIYWK